MSEQTGEEEAPAPKSPSKRAKAAETAAESAETAVPTTTDGTEMVNIEGTSQWVDPTPAPEAAVVEVTVPESEDTGE